MADYGLGRKVSVDERDHGYLMTAAVAPTAEAARPPYRYWYPNGMWGDQGPTPRCVGFAWGHYLEDGPITHAPLAPGSGWIFNPDDIYREAQLLDVWPGENYDGTSVRAGAKALQRRGLVGSYYWAWSLDAVLDALAFAGPVVVGTRWYQTMFSPDEHAMIRIGGGIAGGHAYVLDGYNLGREVVRIKNSWGRSWGNKGFAYISFDDLERLLNEGGEACIALELPD